MSARSGLTVFYVAFAAFVAGLAMFFHQDAGVNANSRLMLSLALVEHHTHVADPWADTTVDKAVINGHVYCDKSPLASYVAAVALEAWRFVHGPIGPGDMTTAYHLAIATTSAIPFGIFGALVLRRVLTGGAGARGWQVWLVSLCLFGTFVSIYGGFFMAHTLAGLFLVSSYILAAEQGRWFWFAGLLGGCAGLTEYPLIVFQALMALAMLLRRDRRRGLVWYLLGAAVPAFYLLYYNALITGSPWVFPYQYTLNFPVMHHLLGVGLPRWPAIWGLLFSLRRGLVFHAPVLLVLVPLIVRHPEAPPWRRWLVLCGAGLIVLFYGTISYWEGGWCFGPRYLTAVVMLMLYEGCAAAARRPGLRAACLALGGMGLAVTLLAAATDPMIEFEKLNPLLDWIWPRLRDGFVNPNNILQEMGLSPGRYLIVVWLGLWAIGTWAFARWTGTTKAGPGSPQTTS
ncbi:MAG TPA: hypothetical protein VMV94_07910 [Phycisphaerae bacterium]|nr:hypothetical protein [Phycisphaerae bacterium]